MNAKEFIVTIKPTGENFLVISSDKINARFKIFNTNPEILKMDDIEAINIATLHNIHGGIIPVDKLTAIR